MVTRLRGESGTNGLVTANGGYLTKHAIGIYATEPPAYDYRAVDVQAAVDAVATTPVDEAYAGPVTVEAYTVMHSAEGPEEGLCALTTSAGARTWGRVTEVEVLADMTEREAIGRTGTLAPDGNLVLT